MAGPETRGTEDAGDPVMTSFEKLRERMLADQEVRAEYDRLGPIYEVVGALIDARHQVGLPQAQLAARLGTTPSVVARLEPARRLPHLALVNLYSAATGPRIGVVRAACKWGWARGAATET